METMKSLVQWLVNLWNIMCRYSRRHGNKTSISSLPNKLIIDILNRLPAEGVLACRAVCSTWHRLTNTTDFTQRHLNLNTTSPMLLGRITDSCGNSNWFYIDDLKLKPRFNRINVNGSDIIRSFCNEDTDNYSNSSCKGLLLLRDQLNKYMIWNPVTREEITFDLRNEDTICGFYFHVLENQFKFIIFQRNHATSYVVYGLSTNVRKGVKVDKFVHYTKAVAACGALFWEVNTLRKYNGITVDTLNIMMFNLETESFVLKPQPTSKNKPHLSLLESEGKLWCCDIDSKLVQVWILEDVRRWKWVKSYLVDLNGHASMNNINGNKNKSEVTVVMGVQKGNLLLYRSYVGLFWCNLKRKTVWKLNTGKIDLQRDFVTFTVSATQYVKSLVPLRENNILPITS